MSTDQTSAPQVDEYWREHRGPLFLASCMSLIVTAMSFAIRGDIMTPLGDQFHLSGTQLGAIGTAAFWGFTLAMIIGGPLCDILGMRLLMVFAGVGHLVGILTTIFASGYSMLLAGTLAIGLANGFVEAACNPLIATLYPDQKIKRLNLFHVWFPGGIVIGGLASYAISKMEIGGSHAWQIKMATMILPLIVYGFLFTGKKFPKTERVASGVSMGNMVSECMRPFFLLFVVCMLMTAITELGPQQWFPAILTQTTGVQGILFLIWITGLMAIGRSMAGPIVHRISPVGVLMGSAFFSIIGLYMISTASSAAPAFIAATLFAIGVCFFWPTMLGVVSERFPKTGSLGLAIMGGAGNLSSGLIQPIIGATRDIKAAATLNIPMDKLADAAAGPAKDHAMVVGGSAALQQVVILPVILLVIFTLIFLYDKSRGGYKQEVLNQVQED